ncbi:MAG: MFS transporter [Nitrospirae bacterium]|nr:MFS transporter [Nitrospirota bacterium]
MNKRQIVSWCLFDFANSSYSAVIAAVIFPVYYANVIVGNETGMGDLWWGRAISLSMAFIAVTSPLLGGIADYSGIRKRLLFVFTALSISAVAGFSILQKGMFLEGFILIVLANIGMEGGLVFYNSFLPEITEREYQGRVSAWGYGVGYIGSIISLILAIPLVNKGYFDAIWLMVALFFAFFSIPAFLSLPHDRKDRFTPSLRARAGFIFRDAASKGFKYTWNTFKEIWSKNEPRKFLIAYLIYEDGVNTVIVFSSIFAATTLSFAPQELIGLYLAVQTTALTGAFLMARPIDFWGPKKVATLSLLMWTTVTILAFFVQTKGYFWLIACIAGLGLGTVQAATRAFFAQFIPPDHESEYFGVYSMVGKSSAIIGPSLFGYISSSFGSQRPAILSVALFFLIGLIILQFVRGGGPNVRLSLKGRGYRMVS